MIFCGATMGKLWKAFLDALYPEGITCDLCGAELDDGGMGLCPGCKATLHKPKEEKQVLTGHEVFSVYSYDSVREMILGSKDNGKPYLTKTMAKLLAEYYKGKNFPVDVVTYVPCGKKNFKRRGYDHMEYVAEEFCRLARLPLSKGLKRIKETSDQTQVGAEKRYENVRGVFQCVTDDLSNKRVLLLDDLVTSGATLSACMQALLAVSVQNIICLTLGKAGE